MDSRPLRLHGSISPRKVSRSSINVENWMNGADGSVHKLGAPGQSRNEEHTYLIVVDPAAQISSKAKSSCSMISTSKGPSARMSY